MGHFLPLMVLSQTILITTLLLSRSQGKIFPHWLLQIQIVYLLAIMSWQSAVLSVWKTQFQMALLAHSERTLRVEVGFRLLLLPRTVIVADRCWRWMAEWLEA